MANAKDVLSPSEYKNYRNVRAVSRLFIVVGSVYVLGGLGIALSKDRNPKGDLPPVAGLVFACAGLGGVIGGFATLRGSRDWSRLIYVMASVYLFAFPLGTIMTIVLFNGLSEYFHGVEVIADEQDAEDQSSSTRRRGRVN